MIDALCCKLEIFRRDDILHIPLVHDREEYDRKSRSGIKPCPFARNGKAEEYSRKSERYERLNERCIIKAHLRILIHEVVHQHYECGHIHIYRRYPRLREVHEVKGEQQTADDRKPSVPEQPPCKQEDHRHHEYTEQRSDYTPAERVHAAGEYAPADKHLSERRMRPFVHSHLMQELVRGASVIYLVKVGLRHIGFALCELILLIEQVSYLLLFRVYRRYKSAVSIQDAQLLYIYKVCGIGLARNMVGR